MSDIKGYKPLSEEQKDVVNLLKEHEQIAIDIMNAFSMVSAPPIDERWMAIAKNHIQQGFMAAVRSVSRPDGD